MRRGRRSNSAFGCLGLVVLLLCGALALGRGGSTPPSPPPNPPATVGSQALSARAPVGTSAPLPTAAPTDTTIPPTEQPHIGSTLTVDGWVISLAQLGWTYTLRHDDGTLLTAGGRQPGPDSRYWLVWVDARNVDTTTSALSDAVSWRLRWSDAEGDYTFQSNTFPPPSGRDAIDKRVPPGGLVHPWLVFEAGTETPVLLLVDRAGTNTWTDATFRLAGGPGPIHLPEPPPDPTVTPRPAAASYNAVPSGTRIGATCSDGTHSDATGRGACSHHGGVVLWLLAP